MRWIYGNILFTGVYHLCNTGQIITNQLPIMLTKSIGILLRKTTFFYIAPHFKRIFPFFRGTLCGFNQSFHISIKIKFFAMLMVVLVDVLHEIFKFFT